MYIFTLVSDVFKVVEHLRIQRGDYKLAMLFNSELDAPSSWNLILSADWMDRLGVADATSVIAHELHLGLGLENRGALSRVTVLRTIDPFVRDMAQFMGRLYPVLPKQGGVPVSNLRVGGVTGAGYVFYSQPEVPA